MSGSVDSVQLFQNIAMPIFYVGAILIIIISFNNVSLIYKLIIFFALILNGWREKSVIFSTSASRSGEFIQELSKRKILKNNIYVTYRPKSWFHSIFKFNEKTYNLGNYFSYLKNNTQPVSLDIFEMPNNTNKQIETIVDKAIKSSAFNKYIEYKKKNGIFKSILEYQVDFIVENNITILVTMNSVVLPNHLERLIVERIQDDISNEVVCILNY
jgi:hypothetical protein